MWSSDTFRPLCPSTGRRRPAFSESDRRRTGRARGCDLPPAVHVGPTHQSAVSLSTMTVTSECSECSSRCFKAFGCASVISRGHVPCRSVANSTPCTTHEPCKLLKCWTLPPQLLRRYSSHLQGLPDGSVKRSAFSHGPRQRSIDSRGKHSGFTRAESGLDRPLRLGQGLPCPICQASLRGRLKRTVDDVAHASTERFIAAGIETQYEVRELGHLVPFMRSTTRCCRFLGGARMRRHRSYLREPAISGRARSLACGVR